MWRCKECGGNVIGGTFKGSICNYKIDHYFCKECLIENENLEEIAVWEEG